MYVVCVTVFVKEGLAEQFIEATLDNARNTRNEPGNIRFDVLRSEDDPCRFFLYEVYRAKEDFARHQQTGHYARWKEKVAGWMARPREGVRHVTVFFGDDDGRGGHA